MLVRIDIRVEIAVRRLHDHLLEQPCFRELVQRVVNRGEGNRVSCGHGFLVKEFRRHMAMTMLEQEIGKQTPLPRWPETRTPQTFACS